MCKSFYSNGLLLHNPKARCTPRLCHVFEQSEGRAHFVRPIVPNPILNSLPLGIWDVLPSKPLYISAISRCIKPGKGTTSSSFSMKVDGLRLGYWNRGLALQFANFREECLDLIEQRSQHLSASVMISIIAFLARGGGSWKQCLSLNPRDYRPD